MDIKAIGEAVRARRLKLRMRQSDLAEAADISTKTVNRLETGTLASAPRRETLTALDKALGFRPGSLWDVGEGAEAPDLDEPTDTKVRAGLLLLVEAGRQGQDRFMEVYDELASKLEATVMAEIDERYLARKGE